MLFLGATMYKQMILAVIITLVFCTSMCWADSPAQSFKEENVKAGLLNPMLPTEKITPPSDLDDLVDYDAALAAAADYLKAMQADITEDNAGNGFDGVDENPDDPDDGGWDWRVTSPPDPFHHSTSPSSTNLYGVTALGVYYAYLETHDHTLFTTLLDAANWSVNAGPDVIRTGTDMKFLMLFNDLYSSEVHPTTVYEDAAKAKYDGRIAAYGGSATALAEYIRDVRAGQGYENGIIAWDIGIYAVAAQMLYERFGGTYDIDADDIAEVLWQDSFNDNPGYFDIIDDAGWDSTYSDYNFYWYNLGITGLIDGFSASNSHTSEIPELITLLLDSQYPSGAISYCYGAHEGDEDWQSTGYAGTSLGAYDQESYQSQINYMGLWLAQTQDTSGGWVYSSGNHYPEIGGECAAALYFTSNDLITCDLTILSPYVHSDGGPLDFSIAVTNISTEVYDSVYMEIFPTLGDCATGTVLDFNLTRLMTTDLGPGETFTGYYYLTFGNQSGRPNLVALGTELGSAPNDYSTGDCGEFIFLHPYGRDDGSGIWTVAEWGERKDTGVNLPKVTVLNQNYPNPFNARTSITFDLSDDGDVRLEVYNLMGQKVETLIDGITQAGQHTVSWDAATYSSGLYFYRLTAGENVFTKRMTLLK
ncbi:MAG: T9SS type A sorting domain-containing protein [candidate division Zixibacteria bacterium]|nr:T9SS type A sorting domain-containing protein [candidate division Zixibacteria bacterium]